jgi:hypothetical protein
MSNDLLDLLGLRPSDPNFAFRFQGAVLHGEGRAVLELVDDEILLEILPRVRAWVDSWFSHSLWVGLSAGEGDRAVERALTLSAFRDDMWAHLEAVTRP